MADIQLIQCKNQQKTFSYRRNIVPYKEIGIKESNDDVRTLTSHPPRFYGDAVPNFLKMGIKMQGIFVFWTTSTIKDEKSAAKFHYIKNVSGKVAEHSIAFRAVSIYWHGDDPFPLKSCLQVTGPLLSMVSHGRCRNS